MYYTKREVNKNIELVNDLLESMNLKTKIFFSCKDDDIERDCLTIHVGKNIKRFTSLRYTSDKVFNLEIIGQLLTALKDGKIEDEKRRCHGRRLIK